MRPGSGRGRCAHCHQVNAGNAMPPSPPVPATRTARRALGALWWLAPCAVLAIASPCAADVIERDITPQVERAQAQQRLDLELRQARRPLPSGRIFGDQALRQQQRDTVERLRQQSLQSQQRNELQMRRGQLRGGEGYTLQQRFEEQHRQQMLRNRDGR